METTHGSEVRGQRITLTGLELLDEGLDVRNPTSDAKENGNIVNPRRFAEFGGLSSGSARGLMKNPFNIDMPSSTQRRVPQKNTRVRSGGDS